MSSDLQLNSGLSERGITAASDNGLSLIFNILANVYHEEFNPEGYVSLGVAENALMHETLADYINQNFQLPTKHLTYGAGGNGSNQLRSAIAYFLTRRLRPARQIEGEHVVTTNGCSSAIEHCAWMFADPGDGILLGQPYYGTFPADMQVRPQAKVVMVRFDDVDPMSLQGVKCYEDALARATADGIKVKALMLCNPHNPLGRCYSRETIIEYMRFCQKNQLHLISDEIYALSIFKNEEDIEPPAVDFVSALSIDPSDIIDAHLVHILWGLSKDFGANGLRLGAIISQSNPALIRALGAVTLYSYPSSMIDMLASKMLTNDSFVDAYISENSRRISKQYSFAVRFLKKHNIEYAPGANAAFFLWVNLGKAYSDRHTTSQADDQKIFEMLLEKKVFLANGTAFGSEKPGWFRMVFTQEKGLLLTGLERMLAAID